MTELTVVLDELEKANIRHEQIQKEELEIIAKIVDLSNKYRELCSHPIEYMQPVDNYEYDDYGKLIHYDTREYQCRLCKIIISIEEYNERYD